MMFLSLHLRCSTKELPVCIKTEVNKKSWSSLRCFKSFTITSQGDAPAPIKSIIENWKHLYSRKYTVLVIRNGSNLCITFIGDSEIQYREYRNGIWTKLTCSASDIPFNPQNKEVEELVSMQESERIDNLIKIFINYNISLEQEHFMAQIFTTRNSCCEIQKYPTSGTETEDSSSEEETQNDSGTDTARDYNNNIVQIINFLEYSFGVTLTPEGDIEEVRRITNYTN